MQRVKSLSVEQLVILLQEASEPDRSVYAEELIRRFEPLLRRAWLRGAFHTEYQDFVQDVFVRLFGGLASLRNPKAFPGYFRKIALSVAASHGRRSIAFEHLSLGEVELIGVFDEELLPRIFVKSYIEELPSREKEVITLAFLEDLPNTEIAMLTGLTTSAVRATKTRALKRIRKILFREAKALEESLKIR